MIYYEFKVEPSYVYTHCSGSFTVDDILQVFDKSLSLAKKNRLTAILVDVRDLGGPPPTIIERHRMGEGISKVQRKYSPLIGRSVWQFPFRCLSNRLRSRLFYRKMVVAIQEVDSPYRQYPFKNYRLAIR